eukprot:3942658-Pleurochrysis_carterae.AAC.2
MASMRAACMSFHRSLRSARTRAHLTCGDEDDASASSNGSLASANSGAGSGTVYRLLTRQKITIGVI